MCALDVTPNYLSSYSYQHFTPPRNTHALKSGNSCLRPHPLYRGANRLPRYILGRRKKLNLIKNIHISTMSCILVIYMLIILEYQKITETFRFWVQQLNSPGNRLSRKLSSENGDMFDLFT